MSREVDVSDCTGMGVKDMLNRGLGGGCQVPYKSFLVGGTDDAIVSRREGGPLDIRDFPWSMMRQMPRRGIG